MSEELSSLGAEEQAALRAARPGAVVGPFRAGRELRVFVVKALRPAVNMSLEQARPEIARRLSAWRAMPSPEAFKRDLRSRARVEVVARAVEHEVDALPHAACTIEQAETDVARCREIIAAEIFD